MGEVERVVKRKMEREVGRVAEGEVGRGRLRYCVCV